jgi:F0F1-type ATP synthase assembly protein I
MDNDTLQVILSRINDLHQTLNRRSDSIETKIENFVSKDDCEISRKNCTKKAEIKVKLITAVGGVVLGIIGSVIALLKLDIFN